MQWFIDTIALKLNKFTTSIPTAQWLKLGYSTHRYSSYYLLAFKV